MSNVFVLGSINVDLVFSVDRLPTLGETIKGQDFFLAPGGKGANQAVACAKQGVSTWMLGSVGKDALAETALESLKESGVHCDYITQCEDQHTGVAGIFLEQEDNRIIIGQGANSVHDIESIQSVLKMHAEPGDVLLCQLEIPQSVLSEVLPYASKLGLQIVLNAAPAEPLESEILNVIDLLIVNETELMTLTNNTATSMVAFQDLGKNLLQQVPAIIVTLGEDGSFYIDSSGVYTCDAKPVKVVDTTAAGDTFIGGYIAAMLDGLPITERLEYASTCASLAIQTLGAQPSIPTKKDVLQCLQKEEEINE